VAGGPRADGHDGEPRGLSPGILARARSAGELFDGDRARSAFRHLLGISSPDAFTLEVELEDPTPFFLDLVGSYPLFPVHRETIESARERWPETWQVEWVRPENIVTNGPFRVVERRINDRIRLERNPVYWDADNVAMRTIDVLAVEHYGTMLNMYLTGEIDWIDRVASNLVTRLLRREDFTPEPYVATYFYRVDVTEPHLADRRVRRALALSIDRRAITESITKAGQIPSWALVPHGIPGYERAEMEHAPQEPNLAGYDAAFARDCERARELLAEAGFGPGGADFPTMEIHYNTAEAHRDIAGAVADGWKRHLGIDAKLLNQEWKVYLDTQANLDFQVSRSSWIGDYADPNTFLDLFVTGGENNRTGWGEERYDRLIEAARKESDPERRLELLHDAEELLMEELPVLPVYTYVTQNMRRPRLGGFHENRLDEHFAKFLYWMDDDELAARRAAQPAEWELVEPGGPAEGLYAPAHRRDDGARAGPSGGGR